MSHVHSPSRHDSKKKSASKKKMKAIMNERRWQYVRVGVTEEVLTENFSFLNDAVVIRSSADGIPLMTTTGIYGPIHQDQKVSFAQGTKNIVEVHSDKRQKKKDSLLTELKSLRAHAKPPKKGNSIVVQAKWISGNDGGALPSVGSSANVFGATGSLLVNEPEVNFPVLDINHKDFHSSLAYYGAKLLQPKEPFYMGFDKPLFGIEYDTHSPGYIRDYAMKSFGGGGLFVEHHPFPHIWFPNPAESTMDSNICRILLGRVIESEEEQKKDNKASQKENECPNRKGDKLQPKYHFTIFRIPSNAGYALAVDECCIHNDSFCKGRQVVFLANTDADTVALRKTSPFENIRISEEETPHG